jgi:hypothetical protein
MVDYGILLRTASFIIYYPPHPVPAGIECRNIKIYKIAVNKAFPDELYIVPPIYKKRGLE